MNLLGYEGCVYIDEISFLQLVCSYWTCNVGVQISHVYNKHPLVALDGIFLYLYHNHNGLNQIKTSTNVVQVSHW